MQVFRGTVIPSTTGRSCSPPPPPPRAGEHHFFPLSSLRIACGLIMQLGGGDHRRITALIRVLEVGDDVIDHGVGHWNV